MKMQSNITIYFKYEKKKIKQDKNPWLSIFNSSDLFDLNEQILFLSHKTII